MLHKSLRISAFCIFTALFVSSAHSQTMTLITATAPRVNRVISVGNATTPGYVRGTTFSSNFTGYTASIGFTGASGVVKGANPSWTQNGIAGTSWAPTIGGAAITTNYLAASSGTVTLNFSTQISQFQFLWGSPSFGDTVTLFNGATQVGQFTGAQVNAASAAFTSSPSTTVVANLKSATGVTFNRVTINNPTSTFEFSIQRSTAIAPTVAGGAVVVPSLPSPAPFPMLGATLFGNFAAMIGMFAMWRKKYRFKKILAHI
jgi:hypothetical protein